MADDIPAAGRNSTGAWGSDIIADALAEQQIPYACIVPGASFRGLHDSLVNYLGPDGPKMLVCLHEEHCVSIAHGWAQVTGEPLAAILHTNVGLMHACMTIFNTWCDRMPVLILGASGPFDAEKRRPWIEWIHSAQDLGAQVRDYTKWDDAPISVGAAVESIRRGAMIARTSPMGPVYINLDVTTQEEWVDERPAAYELANYQPPSPPMPRAEDIDRAYEMIQAASNPILLVGRVSRDEAGWAERVAFAETFNLPVYAIYNTGCGFPIDHPLHRGIAQHVIRGQASEDLAASDLIVSLDWTDLGGLAKQVWPEASRLPPIVLVSDDYQIHRGWSMDYHRLQPAALRIGTRPESFVSAMLLKAKAEGQQCAYLPEPHERSWKHSPASSGPISLPDVAAIFREVTDHRPVTLVSQPIGWPYMARRVGHPLDYLGSKGGEGLGAGPGILVGAALALRDRHPDRLPVAVLGDGDFMMGSTSIWTAASAGIPMLAIIANNRSYFNDVKHQEQVAIQRDRPVENRHVGLEIDHPAPDIVAHAESLGCEGARVTDLADLKAALVHAVERVEAGVPFVLDVATAGVENKNPAKTAG